MDWPRHIRRGAALTRGHMEFRRCGLREVPAAFGASIYARRMTAPKGREASGASIVLYLFLNL